MCGEYEITDVNRIYILTRARLMSSGWAGVSRWPDTGTPDSLVDAASFVRTLEVRQGFKICCPEEIAFDLGFIDDAQLEAIVRRFGKSAYGPIRALCWRTIVKRAASADLAAYVTSCRPPGPDRC